MDAKAIKTACYATLSALEECGGSSPASMLYIALGMDMQAFESVRDLLLNLKLVTVSQSSVIELTPSGSDIAKKINAIVAANAAARSATV